MQSNRNLRKPRGFSLVELLIAIAILGTIAAIAVVSLSDIGSSARVTTAKSQAQRIASVFAAGFAAGAPAFSGANSVSAAMNAVGAGSTGSGTTRSAWFQLPGISAGMDDDEPMAHRARHYLTWEDGMLVYNPEGGGSSGGYSSFDAWLAAMNEAMGRFFNQNPGAQEMDLRAFHEAWLRDNPPPQRLFVAN